MNERLISELFNLANYDGTFSSAQTLAREAIIEIKRLDKLVEDKCKLLADMQRELGMKVTDGLDGDPLRWCREIKAKMDLQDRLMGQLEQIRAIWRPKE